MCEECVVNVALMLESVLEEEDTPLEVAFASLHTLVRLLELSMEMPSQEMSSLSHQGRELGERLFRSGEDHIPVGEDHIPVEEEQRSLLLEALLKPHDEKPN